MRCTLPLSIGPFHYFFLLAAGKLMHNFNQATKGDSSWGIEPENSQMEELNESVLQIKGILCIIQTNVF